MQIEPPLPTHTHTKKKALAACVGMCEGGQMYFAPSTISKNIILFLSSFVFTTQHSNVRLIQGRNLVLPADLGRALADTTGRWPGLDPVLAAPPLVGQVWGCPSHAVVSSPCAAASIVWMRISLNEGQWSGAWVVGRLRWRWPPAQSRLLSCRTFT